MESREQLQRMLASPTFGTNKRISNFLRYVVEETLNGNGAGIKERTIGVQVFGKELDYDTNSDSIVRVSAGELRKKIAQYYHEAGREAELRIDLPVGSYVPTFRIPEIVTPTIPKPPPRKWPVFVASGTALCLVALWMLFQFRGPGDAYSQFWQPVVNSPGSVLVYVGAGRRADNRMAFEDALALADLTSALHGASKAYRVMTEPAMTPENLRKGPALLIGAFTNAIVLRLTGELRFTFAMDGDIEKHTEVPYIKDRQDLGSRKWSMKTHTPRPTIDYAIISRVTDPTTGHIAVVSGGIGGVGTLSAAEFLATPSKLNSLTKSAPRDWRHNNMQAVLEVHITPDGQRGETRVIGTYFW